MRPASQGVNDCTRLGSHALWPALLLWVAVTTWAANDDALPPPPIDSGSDASRPASPPTRKTISEKCRNCGVVRSIRQVERERPAPVIDDYIASPQYLDTRTYSEPRVGPLLGYKFGPGTKGEAYVGAAGDPQLRRRLKQITYEVVLRFEDERFGLFEQDDVSDLHVGDKVKVVDNRVVRSD